MAKRFDDDEFQRLLESGDLPEIPTGQQGASIAEDTKYAPMSDTPSQGTGPADAMVESIRELNSKLEGIGEDLKATLNLLTRVMEG